MVEQVKLYLCTYVHVDRNTDKKFLDDSYELVTHFPDFLLWKNRIAYFE